uniref:Uncharacterized protein n=1 Tax=Lactuca sativa TaxID=4236 RepID=A0A9R1XKT3_LACSA|nr:hypothetical protein LSAT_V11C300126910 [Lactuca sativa]
MEFSPVNIAATTGVLTIPSILFVVADLFNDLPKFQQRYLINSDHWVGPGPNRLGPIFLYCGNKGDIEWFATGTGFVWELTPRFGAMVIFPEVKALITLLYINFFTCRPLIIQFYQNLRDLI